jgi:hypothetical protein
MLIHGFQPSRVTKTEYEIECTGFRVKALVVNRTERQQTECLVADGNRWSDSAVEQCPRWRHDLTFVCDDLKIKAYGGMYGEQFSQVLT